MIETAAIVAGLSTAVTALIVLLFVFPALWAASAAFFFFRMRARERAGKTAEAALQGERWARLWPFRRASSLRLASLYLASDRADPAALEGMARVLEDAEDPALLARTVVDRARKAGGGLGAESMRRALETLEAEGKAGPADRLRLGRLYRRAGEGGKAKGILAGVVEGRAGRQALLDLRDIALEEDDRSPEAESILRESLMYEPDHEAVVLALYRILEDRWDTLESSLGLYEKALTVDPSLTWAHVAVAEILKSRGREEEAVEHYLMAGKDEEAEPLLRARLEEHPRDEASMARLKDFYLDRKRVDADARAIYAQWQKAFPKDLAFEARLLDVFETAGFTGAEAVGLYEKAVASEGGNVRVRRLLSKSYRDAGRVRDAVWILEEAREDFPGDLDTHRDLVHLYTEEKVTTHRALSACTGFLEREFNEEVGAFLRTHFLSNDEPEDLAERTLALWREKHPEDVEVLVRLARLYTARDDAEKGIAVLKELRAKGRGDPWILRDLAAFHAAGADTGPEAEEAYARAIAGGVASERVVLLLARIYATQKRRDPLAAEVYNRASGMEACPPEVKVALAEVYFGSGGFDDAASLCREILNLSPGHEEAARLEARALLKAGRVEGALEGLWNAYRASPGDFRAAEDLAEALASKGDTAREAVAVYEAYLDLARKGKGRVELATGWKVMKALGVSRFLSGDVEGGLSIVKALFSKKGSRPAAERLVGEIGKQIQGRPALALGMLLVQEGEFSRAGLLLHRGLDKEPQALSRILAGIRRARKAHPDKRGEVLAFCLALAETAGEQPALQWEIADIHLEEGDVEEAATRTRAILGPGKGPDPALPRDLLLEMRDRWLERIAGGAESASALYIQGRTRQALGEPGEALKWLKRSRTLDAMDRHPLDAMERAYRALIEKEGKDEHRERLADLHVETGDLDEAIPVLQGIGEDYGRKREVLAKLAKCFLEKGHPLIASKNLERALGEEEVTETNAEMFYVLAGAYEAAGDLRKAKITFEKIGFWRYDFQDVRQRLDNLGKRVSTTPSTPVTPSPLSPVSDRLTIGGIETAELPAGKVEGGRFEILTMRGRGGMAVVYKALDHEFDPPLLVALKVLPDEFTHREKAVRLLKREASAAIQLNHPGIVRIFSTGEEQGKRYISMEYIEGPDLARILDTKGKLPAASAEAHLRQILDALGYAHGMGVIHKDVKPSNIMLTEDTAAGKVKITDFGIARIVTDQIGFSRTLSVRGTLPYMSPQQIAGEQADAQSDIYSAGVMAYEMLTGDPPFVRGDVAYQHTYKAPIPPSEITEDVPPRLEAVVMRCLEKKPAKRYKSTVEVLEDLEK